MRTGDREGTPIRRARWLAWWYAAIGAGFILLAVRLLLVGAALWQVGLRLVVAAGFLLLAYGQFRNWGGKA